VLVMVMQILDECTLFLARESDRVNREVTVGVVQIDVVPHRCDTLAYIHPLNSPDLLSSGMSAARIMSTVSRVCAVPL
jgi:hypothetical protein